MNCEYYLDVEGQMEKNRRPRTFLRQIEMELSRSRGDSFVLTHHGSGKKEILKFIPVYSKMQSWKHLSGK